MPVNIVLGSALSPSGLGIRQLEDLMSVFTGCCGQGLVWGSHWTCVSCGKRQAGDKEWGPVVTLESKAAVHKWTYDYLEYLHTWVAQWTGLEPKSFELNYDVEEVSR